MSHSGNTELASLAVSEYDSGSQGSEGMRPSPYSTTSKNVPAGMRETTPLARVHREPREDHQSGLRTSQCVSEISPEPLANHQSASSSRSNQSIEQLDTDASSVNTTQAIPQETKKFFKSTEVPQLQPTAFTFCPGPTHDGKRFHKSQAKLLHAVHPTSNSINLSPRHRHQSEESNTHHSTPIAPVSVQVEEFSTKQYDVVPLAIQQTRSSSRDKQDICPSYLTQRNHVTAITPPNKEQQSKLPSHSYSLGRLSSQEKQPVTREVPGFSEKDTSHHHTREADRCLSRRNTAEKKNLWASHGNISGPRPPWRMENQESKELVTPVGKDMEKLPPNGRRRSTTDVVRQSTHSNVLSQISPGCDSTVNRTPALQRCLITPAHATGSLSSVDAANTSPVGDLATTGSHRREMQRQQIQERHSIGESCSIETAKQLAPLIPTRPPTTPRSSISRQSNISKRRTNAGQGNYALDEATQNECPEKRSLNETPSGDFKEAQRLRESLRMTEEELADKRQRICVGQQQLRQAIGEKNCLQQHCENLVHKLEQFQDRIRQLQNQKAKDNDAGQKERNTANARLDRLEAKYKRYKDHLNLYIEKSQWTDQQTKFDLERILRENNTEWEEKFSRHEETLKTSKEVHLDVAKQLQDVPDSLRRQEDNILEKVEERLSKLEAEHETKKESSTTLVQNLDWQKTLNDALDTLILQNNEILTRVDKKSQENPSVEALTARAVISSSLSEHLTKRISELQIHIERTLDQRLNPLEEQLQRTRDGGSLIFTGMEQALKGLRSEMASIREARVSGESSLHEIITTLSEDLAKKSAHLNNLNQINGRLETANSLKDEEIRDVRTTVDNVSTEMTKMQEAHRLELRQAVAHAEGAGGKEEVGDLQAQLQLAHDQKREQERELRQSMLDLESSSRELATCRAELSRLTDMDYPSKLTRLQDAQAKSDKRIQNLKLKLKHSESGAALLAAEEAQACMESTAEQWDRTNAALYRLEQEAPDVKKMEKQLYDLAETNQILWATLRRCEKKAEGAEAYKIERPWPVSQSGTVPEASLTPELIMTGHFTASELNRIDTNRTLGGYQAHDTDRSMRMDVHPAVHASFNDDSPVDYDDELSSLTGKQIVLQTPSDDGEESGAATLSHSDECQQRRRKIPERPILRVTKSAKPEATIENTQSAENTTAMGQKSMDTARSSGPRVAGYRKYGLAVKGRPKLGKDAESQATLISIKSGLLAQPCTSQEEGLTSPDAWAESRTRHKRAASCDNSQGGKKPRVGQSEYSLKDQAEETTLARDPPMSLEKSRVPE